MPGPFSSEDNKLPLHDQIAEMQQKIQLLEWDKSAYYESSQATMKRNKESIHNLRQENEKLRRRLAETHTEDEQMMSNVFQDRKMEKSGLKNKSGEEALRKLDQKVCDKVKKLNAVKHQTETRRRHLEELKLQYCRAKSAREGSHFAKLRILENQLEKAQLKYQEAEYIMRGYLKIKGHLQDESLTYQSQLDALEAEILKQRQELRELQVMNNDAQLSRDAAYVELQQQEKSVSKEHKERESILSQYKKKAEECKAHTKKAQRAAMHADELSSESHSSATGGEEERTISAIEEAFQRIKEATGDRDTHEVVERFIAQGKTQKHLENLKEENERTLQHLKKQRDHLQARFQEMKYSGDTRLSSRQQMLEEYEANLQREQQRRKEAREQLDRVTDTLYMVRGVVEILSNKLQHITPTDTPVVELEPSSEDYVLELLMQVEQKLLIVQEELQEKNIDAAMGEMEKEEFYTSIEGKLPEYNIRILLPKSHAQDLYEEEIGDDKGDVITRAELKRQSQIIIDSKTKKKTGTKKD
uniref:Outer dynein arm docking complex subunit 3 n=1 Tax=Scleropages formosus TaxID=113540 RepID=A0A8C9RKQ3_SCLFO